VADKSIETYTIKEILNKFINNDFKEFKDDSKNFADKITNFINEQILINKDLLDFKKKIEDEEKNEKDNKIKIKWYKRDWFKIIATGLTVGTIMLGIEKFF
jgi:hypothetical protein